MNNHLKTHNSRDIDKAFEQEKRKKFIMIGLASLGFIVFAVLILYFSVPRSLESKELVTGIVSREAATLAGEVNKPFVIVTLSDGTEARALIPSEAEIKQGAKAELQKTNFTDGSSAYSLIRYLP